MESNLPKVEKPKPKIIFTPFVVINIILFFIVILSSFYFLYFKKDFNFFVEVHCDSTTEECFVRDCTDPDNCPPNQLSVFKRYIVRANDFKKCPNEDCKLSCESELIECIKIQCAEDKEMGESCMHLNE